MAELKAAQNSAADENATTSKVLTVSERAKRWLMKSEEGPGYQAAPCRSLIPSRLHLGGTYFCWISASIFFLPSLLAVRPRAVFWQPPVFGHLPRTHTAQPQIAWQSTRWRLMSTTWAILAFTGAPCQLSCATSNKHPIGLIGLCWKFETAGPQTHSRRAHRETFSLSRPPIACRQADLCAVRLNGDTSVSRRFLLEAPTARGLWALNIHPRLRDLRLLSCVHLRFDLSRPVTLLRETQFPVVCSLCVRLVVSVNDPRSLMFLSV